MVISGTTYSKTCVKRSLQKYQKLVSKTNYRLMQVKSTGGEHSAILLTFIKLPFLINVFFLSGRFTQFYCTCSSKKESMEFCSLTHEIGQRME